VSAVLSAHRLGKRYGRKWALEECELEIPSGHVVGLVGPNGAGKTTLIHLAVGLLTPSAGSIEVLGNKPSDNPAQLARVGFVAQDTPTYARLTVADHLALGAHMNPGWDADVARRRIDDLDLDPKQRAGTLSGGQRAQLALTLAVAKRPEFLILDEPVASLDPLARREFLQLLMATVAEGQFSIVLSSHLVADLERVCDYLVVLASSRVQVAGAVDGLLATHRRLIGILFSPAGDGRMTLGGVGLCPNRFPAQAGAAPGGPPSAAFSQATRECVTRLVRQVLTYQPTSRYWPLQAYELAIFAGLALVLAGFCFWWVRRRFA
jgi:ABC-2 type transport system ATP-binding protein